MNILRQHEEDMLLLFALVGSQSADLVFWVIAQRNMDHEFFEYGLERSLTANGAIAVKGHTHLRSYRLGGMEPLSLLSSGC